MKVKVVKPGTLVWDAEQEVVVQDKPVQVRATGAIREALNSKQIVEVFGDDEDSVANATIGPEVVKVEPEAEAVEPEAEAVEPIEQPKVEATKADKKLTVK